jgi:hypothetical protein
MASLELTDMTFLSCVESCSQASNTFTFAFMAANLPIFLNLVTSVYRNHDYLRRIGFTVKSKYVMSSVSGARVSDWTGRATKKVFVTCRKRVVSLPSIECRNSCIITLRLKIWPRHFISRVDRDRTIVARRAHPWSLRVGLQNVLRSHEFRLLWLAFS